MAPAPGAAQKQCLPPRNAQGEPPRFVTVPRVTTPIGRGHSGRSAKILISELQSWKDA